MYKKTKFIFIFLLLLFTLCSCTAQSKTESIVGKWRLGEGLSTHGFRITRNIEFFPDGKVIADGTGGEYSIEDGKIQIYYSAMDSYSYKYEMKDDTLILKCDDTYASDTTEYIYDKISSTSVTDSQSETTPEEANPLASEYDKVLAEGSEPNGDTYKLVGKQEETFDDVTIKIGVIKNDKWLVPLSTDSPFIDSETGRLWCYDANVMWTNSLSDLVDIQFYEQYMYIGNGCFFHAGLFYNCESQKTYKYKMNEKAGYNDYEFLYSYYNKKLISGQTPSNFENVMMKVNGSTQLLNTSSMEIIDLPADISMKGPFSEGLFYGSSSQGKGFYDKQGKLVINLDEFNIKTGFKLIFINDKCTFAAYNEANHLYKVTIDKSGKVISSEPLEQSYNDIA